MCGIVGMVGKAPVNQAIYNALTVLQHRGQDAAGIVTWGKEGLKTRKSNGLVRDVFRTRHMLRLTGNVGMGHIRYPTAGSSKSSEAQPFYVNSPYGICLAHNGNLTNHDELADLLSSQDRRHLSTGSDSEVLLNVFAHELQTRTAGDPRSPAHVVNPNIPPGLRTRMASANPTLGSGRWNSMKAITIKSNAPVRIPSPMASATTNEAS